MKIITIIETVTTKGQDYQKASIKHNMQGPNFWWKLLIIIKTLFID